MQLQPADYAIGGVAVVFAAMGLFRGFSGTLAFFAASAAAAFAAVASRPVAVQALGAEWARVAAGIAVSVVAFGVVRLIVKKTVNGLLDQPTDSIAGVAAGLLLWAVLVYAATLHPWMRERSALVREVAVHVR